MSQIERRLNRARQIIDFLLEGDHNMKDAGMEFRICQDSIREDLRLFANWGYGDTLTKNRILYKRAIAEVEKTNVMRSKKKRG